MKKIYFIISSVFFVFLGFAQNNNLKTANTSYNDLSYMNAISIYEKAVDRGLGDETIYTKLANSYYFNSDYKNAAKWYSKLFETLSNVSDTEVYYRYSQALKSIGDEAKSKLYLEKFSTLKKDDSRSLFYTKNTNYLEKLKNQAPKYEVKILNINSTYSDFGSSIHKDNFIFTSNRKGGYSNKIHNWTNQPFSDIYVSKIELNGNLTAPVLFSKDVNTKLNESSLIFTNDGKTVYFTRNNYINGKSTKSSKDEVLLKIYKATKDSKGNWSKIEELPFNSNNYNCAHPVLSSDEKTMYFVSDMPGSFGQSDIYSVTISEKGAFGKPKNLGNKINTALKESYPYLSANNLLYFSSDGHLGFGGLDVFASKLDNNGSFSDVYNLGSPLNSSYDDFAYIVDNNGYGYFSSNRTTGIGFDDIYSSKEIIKLPFELDHIIEGNITDEDVPSYFIGNTKVSVFDENMNLIKEVFSDEKGEFKIDSLQRDKKYFVRFSNNDFETKEIALNTPVDQFKTELSTSLKRKIVLIEEDLDLAKLYDISDVYFEFNNYKITKDAEKNLALLLTILEEHPDVTLEILSHTDSRGTLGYNNRLSKRRAKATYNWLISKGISPSRLKYKGLGESKILNECKDSVDCTEDQHKINRRSEFIIKKNEKLTSEIKKYENSILWEISGNGLKTPSYLYGTFHFLCEVNFDKRVEKAIEKSEYAYFELDLNDPSSKANALSLITMKNNQKISNLISKSDFEIVDTFLKNNIGFSLSMVDSYKPLMLSSLFATKLLDCQTKSVDLELMNLFKNQNKTIYGLEKLEDQMRIFDAISYDSQAKELLNSIKTDLKKDKETTKIMVKAYENEDIEKLHDLIAKSDNKIYSDNIDVMLYNRNKNWLPTIENAIKKSSVFIAVGSGHLAGKYGLIDLLRANGYTVKPILK